jgi:hypothetical protein
MAVANRASIDKSPFYVIPGRPRALRTFAGLGGGIVDSEKTRYIVRNEAELLAVPNALAIQVMAGGLKGGGWPGVPK